MYDVYQVKFNETMDSIANKLGITKEELISLNTIGDNVKYGDLIVIPSMKSEYMNYTIKKGDSIYSIALRFNVPVDSILSLNGIKKNEYIYPGDTLMIPKNGTNGTNTYMVKEGDTLDDIASISNLDDILNQNSKIYLMPNQVIIYTKSN